MKKTYFKVVFDKEHYWISSEHDLKSSIAEWTKDAAIEHRSIRVKAIQMTEEKFNNLSEFEG